MKLEMAMSIALISYGLVYSTIAALNFTRASVITNHLLTNLPRSPLIGWCLFFYSTILWFFELNCSDSESLTTIYNCLLSISLILPYKKQTEKTLAEFEGIGLSLTGLGFLLSHLTDMFAIMITVEIISLYLYTLAAVNHDAGTAAAARYFIYGSFMAAFGYTGLLLIYLGTNSFALNNFDIATHYSPLALIGCCVFLSYIAFKLGLFPLHSWLPTVYSNLTFNTLYIFAVISKFFFGQLFFTLLSYFSTNTLLLECLQKAAIIITIGNLIYGTIGGLSSTKVNELIAYSSIAHMGYMFLPLTTINIFNFTSTINASFYYLTYYTISTALFLTSCAQSPKPIIFINDLNQNFSFPIYAGLIVSLLSIAGLPPSLGFLAKWNIWTQLLFSDQSSFLADSYTINFVTQNISLFLFLFSLLINVASIWFYLKIIVSPAMINSTLLTQQNRSKGTLTFSFTLMFFVTFGAILFPTF